MTAVPHPRLVSLKAAARTAGGEAFALSRLLLAGKAALAAAIAWYLAPYVPFAHDEYSYYAPLGVLVSMYPTIADSAKAGLQAVGGLAIGIAIGLVGLWFVSGPSPRIVGVAIVVGVGVAVGGIRALGTGRDWIAIAALFVLLLGANDAGGFSVSYLVTMAFGVVIGVAVNLAIIPPLYLRRASTRLSQLRDAVSDRLEMLATSIADGEPADEAGQRYLEEILDAVSTDVREAARSRKAHPLARRRRGIETENNRRLRALENTVRQTIELADGIDGLPLTPDAAPPRAALAEAVRATARAVARPLGDPTAATTVEDAEKALARVVETVPARNDGRISPWTRTAVDLSRIIDASRPFT
ncbi:FUSC family protein [Microbacterium sp. BDGP8]|uniref:FUSC family protein n=1 Tax=Microbacterium sp. BDGP8 TaxID=3035531 RepID=UPI00249DC8E5|nr:FUSC family protein [Microbacterium sp. BDGP8]WHE36789.1 aromatic acid exporter family protein [Microbacterium sp. BDGP8]